MMMGVLLDVQQQQPLERKAIRNKACLVNDGKNAISSQQRIYIILSSFNMRYDIFCESSVIKFISYYFL